VAAVTAPEWSLVTVLFADVRGFTTFAERATAREALAFLERFFGAAIPTVAAQGGTVYKLLGDGFMAVFEGERHADDAIVAAHAMLDAVDCPIGVGINSGLVLVVEFEGRRDLVGDPVNVAARVQAATRELDEPLLVTEATRMLAEDASLEERATLTLKGRERPVTLHGRRARTTTGRCSS
jgi:adenylate cyclase